MDVFLSWISLKCIGIQDLVCSSRKHNLYNFDPLKPNFYIVKLGFTITKTRLFKYTENFTIKKMEVLR